MPRIKKTNEKNFAFTVGRRKEAVARVRLYEGTGEMLVNNKPIDQYFAGEASKIAYLSPFKQTNTLGKYYATARILGGGLNGQLEAFIHGVSRALAQENVENFRPLLKKAGLLTRDSRTRERRKVGTGGKARRAKQSPKR